MDLRDTSIIDITDFFEDDSRPLRALPPHSEVGEKCEYEEPFTFNMIEDSLGLFEYQNRLPLPMPSDFPELSLGDNNDIDDTNPLDDLAASGELDQQPALNCILGSQSEEQAEIEEEQCVAEGQQPNEMELIQMINYLVEYSNGADLSQQFTRQFRAHGRSSVSGILIEKFKKLKKTKEELIKYCMRKAFKFILELPKNQYILNSQKSQKFSFSKSKNRYLKNISEEKSMNNKFLQQIFGDKDFAQDYTVFLQHFEGIMAEDNERKIKYLAHMLTNQKDGKKRSIQVVKRLPWTSLILQKVRKISVDLLKFSKG